MTATPEEFSSTEVNDVKEKNATEINKADEQEKPTENVNYIALAVAKLTDELINFKGGQLETIVHKRIAETLIKFCKQSAVFAEVVAKTPRTLSDCCVQIAKKADREGIPDLEAFQIAVKFYFPNSDVLFHMQIRHTGAAPSEEEINKPAEKPAPPQTATIKTNNTNKKSSAAVDTNTDTNTISLDLFADDEEADNASDDVNEQK